MTVSFIVAASVLLIVVLAILLWPLLRGRAPAATTRKSMNAAIYREQLRELENDRADGSLAQAAYEEAEKELQRRLLVETDGADEAAAAPVARARITAIVLLFLLPAAAFGIYAWLGNTDALNPGLGHKAKAGEMDQMVEALAARLEKNPDDLRGWAMLARSYKAMRRFDDAEKAFARLGEAINEDAGLLASYADLLAVRANGNLSGKPVKLIEKALELDPDHAMALSLAGTEAYNRKDFATAIAYWERLVKVLPEGSEDAKAIAAEIERLRRENGIGKATASKEPAKAGAPGKPEKADQADKAPASTGAGLRGVVELAKAVAGKVAPTDTVFILARPAEGSRMPLAAKRLTVADLPYEFMLDDSLSAMSGVKLSATPQVIVEARVSRSGDAKAASGDWLGRAGPVKPDAKGVRIVIDQQLP